MWTCFKLADTPVSRDFLCLFILQHEINWIAESHWEYNDEFNNSQLCMKQLKYKFIFYLNSFLFINRMYFRQNTKSTNRCNANGTFYITLAPNRNQTSSWTYKQNLSEKIIALHILAISPFCDGVIILLVCKDFQLDSILF